MTLLERVMNLSDMSHNAGEVLEHQHGGRTRGYASAMYMVEEKDGAYGYVLLINISLVESMDMLWAFAIQYNIQDLILQEAHRRYQTPLN